MGRERGVDDGESEAGCFSAVMVGHFTEEGASEGSVDALDADVPDIVNKMKEEGRWCMKGKAMNRRNRQRGNALCICATLLFAEKYDFQIWVTARLCSSSSTSCEVWRTLMTADERGNHPNIYRECPLFSSL